MEKDKGMLFFVAALTLFLGLSVGYVLGSWRSVTSSEERAPKILGMGTELIDRPIGPDGDAPMQFAIFGPEPHFGQPVNILSGNVFVAEN